VVSVAVVVVVIVAGAKYRGVPAIPSPLDPLAGFVADVT
jgi:hypothetical protein